MDRSEFLQELESKIPEAYAGIDTSEELIHCEMGDFRRWVELKMEAGAEWKCQQAFEFVIECLDKSVPALENALEISFIEDLALGEHKTSYRRIVKKRAPKVFQIKMAEAHEFWR